MCLLDLMLQSLTSPVIQLLDTYQLSEHLKDITKHHEDFVRCEDVSTADAVKDAMKLQWRDFIFRGQKVKLKVKKEIISAEVEKCHFVSKLSFDCLYYYATAKADVRVPGFGLAKEYQFRDLLLYVMYCVPPSYCTSCWHVQYIIIIIILGRLWQKIQNSLSDHR